MTLRQQQPVVPEMLYQSPRLRRFEGSEPDRRKSKRGHLAPIWRRDFDEVFDQCLQGLANRVVEPGTTLAAAKELAIQLAAFPQRCLRSDRLSAYEAWAMPLDVALRNEFGHGIATVKSDETRAGAARFAAGEGRHGKF